MYAVPDVDAVVAVAKALGIHLGPDEAVLYQKYLLEQLREFDTFVQARLEEPTPPMVSAARQPGYRPTPEEDPLNAWMWKCRIAGAPDGLLAGKTVKVNYHPQSGWFEDAPLKGGAVIACPLRGHCCMEALFRGHCCRRPSQRALLQEAPLRGLRDCLDPPHGYALLTAEAQNPPTPVARRASLAPPDSGCTAG
jgi:hypothetical protein